MHVLPVCMLCADLCVTLSVCVCTTQVCVCVASQSRALQGRLKSPKFKSGLYTKFRDHGFLLTLERACEAQIWKGILRFRGVKSSKNFWPAGAAPQGRRGQGASRPARPGSGDFCFNNSNGRVHRKSALSTAHDFGQPLQLFPYRVPFLAREESVHCGLL